MPDLLRTELWKLEVDFSTTSQVEVRVYLTIAGIAFVVSSTNKKSPQQRASFGVEGLIRATIFPDISQGAFIKLPRQVSRLTLKSTFWLRVGRPWEL